jgi:hypothetical protein
MLAQIITVVAARVAARTGILNVYLTYRLGRRTETEKWIRREA